MKLAPLETLSLETPVPHVLVVRLNRPQVSNALNTRWGSTCIRSGPGCSRMPGISAAWSSPRPATAPSAAVAT